MTLPTPEALREAVERVRGPSRLQEMEEALGTRCAVLKADVRTLLEAADLLLSEEWRGDFARLRRANEERQTVWADGRKVSLLFRATELGGETGEVLNVAKKIEREREGWRGSRATIQDLADELADVVICADLLAACEGIDLADAVQRKFNATSEKVGLPHRLSLARKLAAQEEEK